MAKVLVTGAAGFLGRALVPALRQAGHEVIALRRSDGDVTEAATWARLPPVEHVFHLAARSFVPESWRDPADFLATNVSGTARGLEYSRANGAHFVYVSGYLYGRPKRLPISEDDAQEPNNPYALSKSLAERICAFYATSMDLPVTVIRPFNVYGPGQRPEFLIPTIVDQVAKGINIRVNDFEPRRDYVHLDDLVSALVRTIERPGGHRVFNIGSGISYSIQDIIDVIQAAAGTHLPVVSSEQPRPNEIPDVRADITRAQTILGWEPRYSFAEGIARLIGTARDQEPL